LPLENHRTELVIDGSTPRYDCVYRLRLTYGGRPTFIKRASANEHDCGATCCYRHALGRATVLWRQVADRRQLRVETGLAVHMRPTVLLPLFKLVELFGLDLVAEKVDAVIEAPEFAGLALPFEADRVAQAGRKDDAHPLAEQTLDRRMKK
jgi:hypothetical protein